MVLDQGMTNQSVRHDGEIAVSLRRCRADSLPSAIDPSVKSGPVFPAGRSKLRSEEILFEVRVRPPAKVAEVAFVEKRIESDGSAASRRQLLGGHRRSHEVARKDATEARFGEASPEKLDRKSVV